MNAAAVVQAVSKAQPHLGDPAPTKRKDLFLVIGFAIAVLTMPIWLDPLDAAYPDLMQKFAIFGIFAIGFNLLFGLTGYLSFGHAAFLGVGSYAAVWSFKLLGMSVFPAILFGVVFGGLFAAVIGFIALRRTGIYFSILTLAFAQMSYNLAYSVLTPITNGETGLRVLQSDPRILDPRITVPLGDDRAGEVVSAYDLDGDGALGSQEFRAAVEAAPFGGVMVDANFGLLDGDVSGALDAEELSLIRARVPMGADRADALLADADGDGDGALSAEEFGAIGDRDLTGYARFEAADANGDGGASASELSELMIGDSTKPLLGDVFGLEMTGLGGFYFCALLLILGFYLSMRIFRSPFGMMLRAIKTNQQRMRYTGLNPRPYALAIFVISGMYAGLAGSMMAIVDPLAGAERMQWTASGEVVLMTILGGSGTLLGPVLGSSVIEYFANILQQFNETSLVETFSFLPENVAEGVASVLLLFVGEGWHLTLGLLFMLVVIFLPGGIMEGVRRIGGFIKRRMGPEKPTKAAAESGDASQPAE